MRGCVVAVVVVVLVLSVAAGCRVVYPGDGRLVLVEPDESVTAMYGLELRRGIHYWDVTSAQLRLRDEIMDEAAIAAHLPIVPDGERDLSADPRLAWYAEAEGRVHVPLAELGALALSTDQLSALFAHEVGHAIGLDHLPEEEGVMSPHVPPIEQLMRADVREFCARWHTPTCDRQ